jgi:hypothetical protein
LSRACLGEMMGVHSEMMALQNQQRANSVSRTSMMRSINVEWL